MGTAAAELQSLIEANADGDVAPLDCPTEEDWHVRWRDRDIGPHEPLMTAARGGAHADRLSWVFLAGYQGAIRHTFPQLTPLLADGVEWCSFVNTEDRQGVLPGTSLGGDDGRALSGWKTWLAASAHVEQLLVSLRGDEPWRYVLVPRDAAGVSIETGPRRDFLPELAQGRVQFDSVVVSEDRLIEDDESYAQFGVAEGTYVRVALNAFMLSHMRRLKGSPEMLAEAAAGLLALASLIEMPLRSAAASTALLGIDLRTRSLAERFEALIEDRDAALLGSWRQDRRLIDMAHTGIVQRAERALGATEETA